MSHRTLQVGEVLLREISQIIAREVEPPADCLITIMKVEVTPDLQNATVFVSVLPENKTGTALKKLQQHTGEIQRLLNKKLTMKFSPRIQWEVDLTNVKYAQIDEALGK